MCRGVSYIRGNLGGLGGIGIGRCRLDRIWLWGRCVARLGEFHVRRPCSWLLLLQDALDAGMKHGKLFGSLERLGNLPIFIQDRCGVRSYPVGDTEIAVRGTVERREPEVVEFCEIGVFVATPAWVGGIV